MIKLEDGDLICELDAYGASVHKLIYKGKEVVLCPPESKDQPHPFMGVTVGRFANRIDKATFSVDGVQYKLEPNRGPNLLHGGLKGFDKVTWNIEDPNVDGPRRSVTFSLSSEDGDQGFPGNLSVKVTFKIIEGNQLQIQYQATTDKATPLNLTNHTYFNLNGFCSSILDHSLQLKASNYLMVNDLLIPSGEIASVKNTVYDFTQTKLIGHHSELFKDNGGYDNCFALDGWSEKEYNCQHVATLQSQHSKIKMDLWTSEPGVQVYTCNWFDGSVQAPSSQTESLLAEGKTYNKWFGVALETQKYPDSPNHANFPNSILRPGEVFKSETKWVFSTI